MLSIIYVSYRVHIKLLEYVGRGKSIIDVGLAQARNPLTTRYHYFELQIVDPGENCYVAIGVARRVRQNGINYLFEFFILCVEPSIGVFSDSFFRVLIAVMKADT